MRKKYIRIIMIILLLVTLKQVCFGISDDFKFVIDTIGVPRYNVLGDEINEEVYYTYNVFSYSNPVSISSRTSKQRFKEVHDKGKWTQNGGSYKGYGIRGEYDILGVDYSGNYIYNVYFPVDAIPETTPDNWNYINVNGALNSWNDNTKFKYNEQLEYMKNSNLLFDTINYANNTIDPYNLVEYNISANRIGLNKVVLNTAATWKTYGIVSVNRINNYGQVRYATLAVKPMAASANISSYIDVVEKIVLDENSDEINLKIDFGANAINLNNYAKKEHIKEIYSDLYINGKKLSSVIDTKTDNIRKSYIYKISRKDFETGTYTLNISSNSHLYTEFYVDGLMRDKKEKNITIQISPKKVVPIKEIDVKVLEKQNNNYYIRDFIETKYTREESSIGMIEKQKHIAINVKKGNIDFNNENLKIYIDDKNIDYNIINQTDKNLILDIKVPDDIKSSILGWETYRNNENNYFDIDFDNIGNRVHSCNKLIVEYNSNNKEYTNEILIDTIDSYKYNINYIFENNLINKKYNICKLEDWTL